MLPRFQRLYFAECRAGYHGSASTCTTCDDSDWSEPGIGSKTARCTCMYNFVMFMANSYLRAIFVCETFLKIRVFYLRLH